MISAKVNPGARGKPESAPFIVVESNWDNSGGVQLFWTDVTPATLIALAGLLQKAIDRHRDSLASN